MTDALADQHFTSHDDVKKWVDSWFASKDDEFFRKRIHELPEKWTTASDGQYFERNCFDTLFTIKLRNLTKNSGF